VAGKPILRAVLMPLVLFLVGLAWVAALILATVPTPISYVSEILDLIP